MREVKWWISAAIMLALGLAIASIYSLVFRAFLANNWGNLASVAGLFLSFLAALFANRASRAANEARDSLLARTLEQEINEGYKLASEMITFVELKSLGIAATECADLLDVPNRIRIRWEERLSDASKSKWEFARQQLELIHGVLRKSTSSELSRRELKRLSKACLIIRTIFVEEQATSRRTADRGE